MAPITKITPKNMWANRIPDKNIAIIPELVISIAVPKSGCFAINNAGIIIINAATTKCLNFGVMIYQHRTKQSLKVQIFSSIPMVGI